MPHAGMQSSYARCRTYTRKHTFYEQLEKDEEPKKDDGPITLKSDKGRKGSFGHHLDHGTGVFRIYHPTEPFINAWNLIIVVTVLYVSFTVPISISVYWWEVPKPMYYIGKVTDVFFMIDLVLHFRTGFVDHHGVLEMDAKHIAHHYLRFWFWFDILATIPWSWFIEGTDAKYIKYAKLPKLLRLGTLFRLLSAQVRFYGITAVLGILLLSGHIGACTWIAFLYSEDRCGPNPCGDGVDENPCCQGVWSLYMQFLRATIGMLLMNLDDMSLHLHADTWIAAYDLLEIIFVIFGVVLVGMMISELQILVNLSDAEGKMFTNNLVLIGNEMERMYVPGNLQQKILCYFDYYWLNQSYFGELRVLQDKRIPVHVRQQVAFAIYKKYLDCVPFIAEILSITEKKIISLELTHRVYLPGDFVTVVGELSDGEMFILTQGKLAVEVPGEHGRDRLIAILEAGAFMGEISILQETRRTASLLAMEPVEILVLAADSLRKHGLLHDNSAFRRALAEFVKDRLERSQKAGGAGSQSSTENNDKRERLQVQMLGTQTLSSQGIAARMAGSMSSEESSDAKEGPDTRRTRTSTGFSRQSSAESRQSSKVAVPRDIMRFTNGTQFLAEVLDDAPAPGLDEKRLSTHSKGTDRDSKVSFASKSDVSQITINEGERLSHVDPEIFRYSSQSLPDSSSLEGKIDELAKDVCWMKDALQKLLTHSGIAASDGHTNGKISKM